MNTYRIQNYTRPEAGEVTIKSESVRDAVIQLLRLTGDSRGICEIKQKDTRHHVLIQNGWMLVVEKVDL